MIVGVDGQTTPQANGMSPCQRQPYAPANLQVVDLAEWLEYWFRHF